MRIALLNDLRQPGVLAAALGARLVSYGGVSGKIEGIATHSDEVEKGDLFVCLAGEKVHGLSYVGAALQHGARALLCSGEPPTDIGACYVLYCDDPIEALLRAARVYRTEIGARVIAVTGSTGKTTVKEAISSVLGGVPHSQGNFNSVIGMPLSVLSMPRAPYWVLELGINRVGEMKRMAGAISPDVAVITNVGSAHIGRFGDLPTVMSEKMELARALPENGVLVLPSELPVSLLSVPVCHILRTGSLHGADICATRVESGEWGVRCDILSDYRNIKDLRWPVPGQIGLSVICLASAVGICENRSAREIRDGLDIAGMNALRMRRETVGEYLLLDDTYNASPEAMGAALEALQLLAKGRPTVAVLGDMHELGAYAPALHEAVGVFAARYGTSALLAYGQYADTIRRGALSGGMSPECIRVYDIGEGKRLAEELKMLLPRGAVVLFKASRMTAMDEVLAQVRRVL